MILTRNETQWELNGKAFICTDAMEHFLGPIDSDVIDIEIVEADEGYYVDGSDNLYWKDSTEEGEMFYVLELYIRKNFKLPTVLAIQYADVPTLS